MNANAGNLEFNIDKEEDYQGEGYDPEDTDCKDVVEAVEYIDLIEQALKERKPFKPGPLLEIYNDLLSFVDVPTKLHLNETQDLEGLKKYRQLRNQVEDNLFILEIVRKAPGELGFIEDCADYEAYIKTYTDIGGSADESSFTEEEFNMLKEYFYKEEVEKDDENN